MFEGSYDYTPALARRAYRQWLWEASGGTLLALPLILLAAWVGLFSPGYRVLSAFALGALLTYLVLLVRSFSSTSRHAADYAGSPIRLRLDAAGITFSAAIIESTTPWSAVRGVMRTRDFLVLSRRGSSQPSLVPRVALTPEAVAFLEERVRSSGGRVRGEVRL